MVLRIEHGKGAKDRYVMLSPRLLDVLREYWRRTRPQGKWLFPGRVAGRHISTKSAHAACRRGWLRSGLSKRLSPHSLRHYSESRIIPSRVRMIGGSSCVFNIVWEAMPLTTRNNRGVGPSGRASHILGKIYVHPTLLPQSREPGQGA